MDQKKTIRPFSMKDKIGYTLGDLGCCFTEQYRAMYLSIFYTLILQVNPFHVGILLLITKIWDAVNDPIIGAMVDSRKATKGGKFIPWIRAFSFPMAVLCILGFVNVGNINYGLRLAYMFVTYVLYEALYTCVNVPFGTLSSVMTDDVSQRTALSRYRSLGGTIFMTVMVMIGPLFLYVDNKPVAGRFLMLACICAMLGLLCLQITCVWCKERVEVPERPQGEKLNYLHVLKEISHNKALLGVMFFSLTGMIGASVVNGLNTYLYKDFFGNVKIQAVSGMLSVLYAVLSFAITQPPCQQVRQERVVLHGRRLCRHRVRHPVLLPRPQPCDVHRHQRYLLSGRFRHAGADLGYGQRRHRLPRAADRRAQRGHRLLHLLFLPQACKRHFRQPVQLCAGCHRLQRYRRRCADRRRCERHLEELHRHLLPGLRHCSCHPVLRLPPDQAEDC